MHPKTIPINSTAVGFGLLITGCTAVAYWISKQLHAQRSLREFAAAVILRGVMNNRLVLSLVLAFLLGAFTLVGAMQQDTDQATMVEASACLECHGPYDELAEATADYVTPSGETATPHQYVPHKEKKVIPKCAECHKSHPIPLESMEQTVKPKYIDWCYMRCHHNWDFQSCISCH